MSIADKYWKFRGGVLEVDTLSMIEDGLFDEQIEAAKRLSKQQNELCAPVADGRGEGVDITDEMVERACKRYAFREDGATFPDAYSEYEVLAELTLMREFLAHVFQQTPPEPPIAAVPAQRPDSGASITRINYILWMDENGGSEPPADWQDGYRAAMRRVTPAGGEDGRRLDWLAREYWRLDPFDMPTGGGDADVGWRVTQYHGDAPRERTVAEVYTDDPRAAIDSAIAAERGAGSS